MAENNAKKYYHMTFFINSFRLSCDTLQRITAAQYTTYTRTQQKSVFTKRLILYLLEYW